MIFKFTDSNGNEGVCDIERHCELVIATELADNTAMSVTNACTAIAAQYCEQNGIRPWDLLFFERYDERSGGTYAGGNATYTSVNMAVAKGGVFHSPVWAHYDKRTFDAVLDNYKSKEILERLYEGQMIHSAPCPRCNKGRAGVATALSRRAKVMVCNQCGMEEAMMDAAGEQPMLFSNWAYIRMLNGKPPFACGDTEGEF